jgi:Domain of unknown function (DUF4926)/Phage integrase family
MKMRERHIVPLASQAVVILRELRSVTGKGRYLFPSLRSLDRPMSVNTVNGALRWLGYARDEMTGHGFRAMACTCLNELGWHPDVIELQMAHAERNKVRAAYNRAERLAERKKMMQAWADYLDELRGVGHVTRLPTRITNARPRALTFRFRHKLKETPKKRDKREMLLALNWSYFVPPWRVMSVFREHDLVVLTSDFPAYDLAQGDVGTVVHIHPGDGAFEVEFTTITGHAVAVLTLRPDQFRPVVSDDINHVRKMLSREVPDPPDVIGSSATHAELRRVEINALVRALGPIGMAQFLQQFDAGRGDYTSRRDAVLGNPTVDELLVELKRSP